MTTTTIRTRPFDMANYLGTDEDVAEYLSQVLADGDPAELAAALGDIARARGMTQLARDTGLSPRKPLQKPFRRTCPQLRHIVQGDEGAGV